MARRHRSRKPRRPRRKLRKNPHSAIFGSELQQVARASSGPELVFFPVNPLSLAWAANAYALQREFASYTSDVQDLIPLLSEIDPEAAQTLIKNGQLDEAALFHVLGEVHSRAKDPDASPALAALARKIDETGVASKIGLAEEMEAITPFPNYGVLAGQGLVGQGLTLPGRGSPEDRIKDVVSKLALTAEQLRRVGAGSAVAEIGAGVGDQSRAAFVVFGSPDDMEGMALFPVAPSPALAERKAASVVEYILSAGLWDAARWKEKGPKWVEGSRVRWALPGACLTKKGTDLTRSSRLVNFIAPTQMTYIGQDTMLKITFRPDNLHFRGVLRQGKKEAWVQGTYLEESGSYQVESPTASGTLVLENDSAILSLPGIPPLKFSDSTREMPGQGDYLMEPGVISWLRRGAEWLATQTTRSTQLVSLLVGRAVDPRVARGVLQAFGRDLAALPMSFLGELPSPDGVPRYLPPVGSPSWYGSPALHRAMASQRRGKRVELSGRYKNPPSLLLMDLLAGQGRQPFAKHHHALLDLREVMRWSEVGKLEEREARAYEKSVFFAGRPQRKKSPNFIPIEGPESVVCSAVITLYGMNEESGEYTVLWQSSPLDGGMIDGIVSSTREAEGPIGPEQAPFSPQLALRRWAAQQSGLAGRVAELEKEKPKGLPPYEMIVALLVDQGAMERWRKKATNLPKILDVGMGQCMGRRASLGLVLSSLNLSSDMGVPDLESLLSVHSVWASPGIVPARLPMSDYWTLAENLAQTGLSKGRELIPLWGTPWRSQDLFSFSNVSRTRPFVKLREWVEKKLAEGHEFKRPWTEERMYIRVLFNNIPPRYLGGRTADVVVGGRRALQAMGGEGSRAKRVGQKDIGGSWSSGQVVSPDAARRVWATGQSRGRLDIFNFAASICKVVGCKVHGVRRTEKSKADKLKQSLASLDAQENVIHQMMAEYGILSDVDWEDPASVRDGLVRLRNAMRPSYTHRTSVGQLPSQVSRLEAQLMEADEGSPLFELYEAEGLDEITDFAPGYLDRIAKLNGRRPRRPRRARRKMRRRTRRNPLREYELEEAISYAESKKSQPDEGDLEKVFSRLRDDSDPAEWPITTDRVDRLFPRKYQGGGTWKPANRLAALGTFDMVSRLGELDPSSELVQKGRAEVFNSPMPVDNEAVRALALAEAGLSLREATRILAAQKGKRSKGFTMAPSSAICKLYRSVKLKGYRPPPQVFSNMESRGGKHLLIWMSPSSLSQARVMSYRRGTHIDCDMVSPRQEDLGELLGRALQSALYWVAEKPQRSSVTEVWVGRVGQPDLYLALGKGQTITLAQVSANLEAAKRGEAGFRLPIFQSPRAQRSGTENDVIAYTEAVRKQFGASAAMQAGEPQVVAPVRQAGKPEPGVAPSPEEEGPFLFGDDDDEVMF